MSSYLYQKMVFIHKKCGGEMKCEWGNGFGRMFQCQNCNHFAVLSNPKQYAERPYILEIDLKRNKLQLKKEIII